MFPLLLILIAGFALRIWGIDFGLPFLYHADEPIVVNHALAYGTWDFNPHFFKIPPLVSYLLFVCYGIYYLLGGFAGVSEFQNLFFDNPSSFFLIARVLFGAVLGTATVYLLYRLILKFFTKDRALIAAFFFSLVFLHVRDSHFIYVDIPLVFVLVACLFPILNILRDGTMRNYLIFGLLAGLAAATKYNGVFIFIPFFAAHLLRNGFRLNLGIFIAGLVSVITFYLLNPFAAMDANFFFRELLGQGKSTGYTGWLHHFTYSLAGGMGIALLSASILGMILARDKQRWVIGSFVISYYLLLCFFSQPYERYVLPLIPFLIFFAADFLVMFSERFAFPKLAVWLMAFVIISPSAIRSVLCDMILAAPDIRTIAKADIESKIPSGSKVALDVPQFMPRLNFSLAQLEQKKAEASGSDVQKKRIERFIQQETDKRYDLYFLKDSTHEEPFLFAKPTINYRLEDLKKAGVQYVLVVKIKNNHPEFYKDVKNNSELIAVFSPYISGSSDWPVDDRPQTGAPFTFRDLIKRNANGHAVEVYKLK